MFLLLNRISPEELYVLLLRRFKIERAVSDFPLPDSPTNPTIWFFEIWNEILFNRALLFREFVKEKPEIWTPKLKKEIYEACRTIISHEDAFIDLAFKMGPIDGLKPEEIKQYIRWIGNRRLVQLGLEPIYKVDKNPLSWLDTMLNAVEHMNFFEGRATEYSKASTKGTWTEAFS